LSDIPKENITEQDGLRLIIIGKINEPWKAVPPDGGVGA
jgi:hypothetical protein